MRIYGPYTRPDGRQHVITISTEGIRRTISYPKYLMELHLGRELDPNLETVDHIDRDFTNNELSNLRVIDRVTHSKEDVVYRDIKLGECVWCTKIFPLSREQLAKRNALRAGPFCGRSCSGKYGAYIRAGAESVERVYTEVTYHKIDKE